MKKIILASLMTLNFNAFAQDLSAVGQTMQPYLNNNLRVYPMQDSIGSNMGNTQRIEILQLQAYLDLSRMDPAMIKLIEKQFAEAKRQARIQEFWYAFSMGANQAQTTIATAGQINPQVCEMIKVGANTGTDGLTRSAFSLGIQSRAPFCFIKDYFAKLQGISANLTTLKKALFQAKLKVVAMNPDEAQMQSMYNEVVEKTKASYLAQLSVAQKDLSAALELDAATLEKVKSAAASLATYISCDQLVSRLGESFNCDLKTAPAAVKLSIGDAYQVLFKGKLTGAFQEQLLIVDLFRAANVFKTEFRPTDIFVDYLVGNLKKELQNLDYLIEVKINKAKELSVRNLKDGFETLAIAQTVALRKLLSDADRERLLTDLFSLKLSLEDYAVWNGSGFDQALMEKLKAQYDEVLGLFGEISVTLNLPKKDILLDLGSDIDLIHLDLPNTQVGPVFLLGKNQKEIDQWLQFLALN